MNSAGIVVHAESFIRTKTLINVSEWASGEYTVLVEGVGEWNSFTIIVQ